MSSDLGLLGSLRPLILSAELPSQSARQPTELGQRTTKTILKQFCSSLKRVVAIRVKFGQQDLAEDDPDLSSGRRAIQMAITTLDVAFSIAETVPVIGAPLKGALESVCKILKLVDVSLLCSGGHFI